MRQFDQFLVIYQTDKPMVPFLCGDLDMIVRGLCQRFMKQSVLDEATSTAQLNIDDVDSHLPHFQIDPGFCAAKKLKELAAVTSVKQKLSERERMAFILEWACLCHTETPREMSNHIHHDEKLDVSRPSVDGWQEGRLHCEVWQSCTSCRICTKFEMRIAMLSSSSSEPL